MANDSNADLPKFGQGWKFIFVDPTFSGECHHIPMMEKKTSVLQKARTTVLECLPPEVQEMLLGNPSGSKKSSLLEVAGSGARAAAHLKRASQDSCASGLSEASSVAGDNEDKKSDSGSGFSDVSDEDKDEEPQVPEVKISVGGGLGTSLSDNNDEDKLEVSKKNNSGGGCSVLRGSKENMLDTIGDLTQGALPIRNDRSTESLLEKETAVPDSSGLSSDEDFPSNPSATDSEEERGLESVRSVKESVRSKKDSLRTGELPQDTGVC